MAVFTYYRTEAGRTHLVSRHTPRMTLCGMGIDGLTLGDETLSGIASDCARCRRHSPAGPIDQGENFTSRRARYRAAVLRWMADSLRSMGAPASSHPMAPNPADFGLTKKQGADAREAIALVLDHRAETGGRVRI